MHIYKRNRSRAWPLLLPNPTLSLDRRFAGTRGSGRFYSSTGVQPAVQEKERTYTVFDKRSTMVTDGDVPRGVAGTRGCRGCWHPCTTSARHAHTAKSGHRMVWIFQHARLLDDGFLYSQSGTCREKYARAVVQCSGCTGVFSTFLKIWTEVFSSAKVFFVFEDGDDEGESKT